MEVHHCKEQQSLHSPHSSLVDLLVDNGGGEDTTFLDEYFSLFLHQRKSQQPEWKEGLVMQVVW
jgi:hypothetical protein